MKNIAVICALPPERNTGMATVDLSAHSVLPRLVDGHSITLYALGKPGKLSYQPGELPYEYINIRENREKFLSSDVFLYWGDFVHSRSYWEIDHQWGGPSTDRTDKLKAEVAEYLFLTGVPDADLKRAVAFGGTIITNEAEDDLDLSYASKFRRLFSNAGATLLRDALSAAKISPLRRGDDATLGCDCAFLLQDSDLDQLPDFTMAPERRGVGVFFGRSPSRHKMMAFSQMVGRALSEECSWIAWFRHYRRMQLLGRVFGLAIPPYQPSAGALLSQLSGYRYIVTDTYHICVNAWRLGIPAVCIGAGATVSSNSLSDKKKEILFEMYGARSLYVFLEDLRWTTMGGLAAKAAQALADTPLTDQVIANIGMHQRAALDRLRNALAAALAVEKRPDSAYPFKASLAAVS